MAPGYENIEKIKEDLWQRRLAHAKTVKTPDWDMETLRVILKSLKMNKSRDPNGLINELFSPNVAGSDLKISLLKLMNKIKLTQTIPKILRSPNITSIHKNKGSKKDLENNRGIFMLSVLRTILVKLLYFDSYEKIDSEMSDSNIGAQKDKNIMNHLFVIYGIINSVTNGKEKCLDLQIYDLEKAFDALWLEDCMIDLYNSCDESELSLIHI